MGPMKAFEPVVNTPYGKGMIIYHADLSKRVDVVKVLLESGEMVLVSTNDIGFDSFCFRNPLPSFGL